MHYIDREFEHVAEEVYGTIGQSEITLGTAWAVFHQMVEEMVNGNILD